MRRTLRQTITALAVTLVALEVVLQLVSIFARPLLARSSGIPGSPDAITILCVGDSHTYGAPLPEQESYPSQLQERLEKRYPSREFRVVNLGFPGVNSGFVASRLEGQLLLIRPHLVIVSAGLNNVWNELYTDSWQSADSTWAALRRDLLRIKLFRLAAVAIAKERFRPTESGHGRWHYPDQKQVKQELAGQFYRSFAPNQNPSRPSEDRIRRGLERDIEWMVKTTHALDVPIIWYNYPGGRKGRVVTESIDAMGARLKVPVVRTGDDLARAIADGHQLKELFVWAAGPHPNGILYSYIVESMLPQVAATLKEWHQIDLDAPDQAELP